MKEDETKEETEEIDEEDKDEADEKPASDKILVYSIAIILALVLIFSLFRLVVSPKEKVMTIEEAHKLNIEGKLDPEQGYMYGPHSFIRFNDLWYFQVQSKGVLVNVPLRFGPREVEAINLYGGLNDVFNNATKIYISFNPLGSQLPYIGLGVGELTQSLTKAFGNEVSAVCDHECDFEACNACKDRPVLSCNNTEEAIISLIESQDSGITLKGNCIEINGKGEDIVKNVDRLLLEFYGVLKTTPEGLPRAS